MSEMTDNAQAQPPAHPLEAVPLVLVAESPVHAGAGGARGYIDLPIQRSVHTGWPILNDSTVRGGLKRLLDKENGEKMFGTAQSAGHFATPDAELLLMPVEAPRGITAYVTCELALRRFLRRLDICAGKLDAGAAMAVDDLRKALDQIGDGPGRDHAWVPDGSPLDWLKNQQHRVLIGTDAFDHPVEKSKAAMEELMKWVQEHLVIVDAAALGYWQGFIGSRLALVADEVFTDYAAYKTDVRTRNVINEEGRAGNLWREENLPVDSVLYTVLARVSDIAAPDEGEPADWLASFLDKAKLQVRDKQELKAQAIAMQLGGDQNLGRGWMRVRRLGAAAKTEDK